MKLEDIQEILTFAQNLALVTHENPDIDGLASMLSFLLAHSHKNILPLVEKMPENAFFLHGIEKIKNINDYSSSIVVDLLVVFDAQCEKRIPEKIRKLVKPKNILIFDHHQREACSGFLNLSPLALIEPEEPSTTSLLYKFFTKLNYKITQEIAENLLAGIYYDTGGFRYENVKGDIFLVSHELTKLGARPNYIAQSLFENIPIEQIEAIKLVLSRLEFLKDGAIAISHLKEEDFKRIGGDKALNDLASFLRSIKGVKISAFIKEFPAHELKVSLRSKAPIEVLSLAIKYGGGGHKYACGFTLKNKELAQFLEKFKEDLRNYL